MGAVLMETYFEQIKHANIMINSLCIFKKLKDDSVLVRYKELLKYLCNNEVEIEECIKLYNEFV